MIKAGLDPVTVYARAQRARERMAREAARDEEIELRWRERDRQARAEDDTRRHELEAEARLMGNIAFLMEKPEPSSADAQARDAERAREKEQWAREKAQRELRLRSREGMEEAEALRYSDITAETSVAAETEFYVHLFLQAGSVYSSAGDAASALAMHWRAFTAYSRYLHFARGRGNDVHALHPASFFASSLVAPLREGAEGEAPRAMADRLGLGSSTNLPAATGFAPASAEPDTSLARPSPHARLAVSPSAAAQGLLITLDDVPSVAVAADTALTAAAPAPAWAAVVARAQTTTATYAYPVSAPPAPGAAAGAAAGGVDGFMRWVARQNFRHHMLEDIDILDGACPLLATIYSCLAADCHRLGEVDLTLNCLSAVRSIRFLCIPEESLEFADVGSCLNNIGVCLSDTRHFREARAYFHAALEVLEPRLQPLHPRLHVVKTNLGKVFAKAPLTRVDLSTLEMSGQAAATGAAPGAGAGAGAGAGMKPIQLLKGAARPLVTNAYQRMLLEAAAPKKPAPVEEKKK
jgi:hypothetical protein